MALDGGRAAGEAGSMWLAPELDNDASPKMSRDLAVKPWNTAQNGLPGMIVVMLPVPWSAGHEVKPREHPLLPALVAKESLPEFCAWWAESTPQQKTDICTAIFRGAVDAAVSGHILSSQEQTELSLDAELCVVCQDGYHAGEKLEKLSVCGHVFHEGCLRCWLKQSPHCPVCRAHSGVTIAARHISGGTFPALLPRDDSLPGSAAATMTSLASPSTVAGLPAHGTSDSESRPGPRTVLMQRSRALDPEGDASEALQRSPPQRRHCHSCGAAGMLAHFVFCPFCGMSVNDSR
eukprot:TRINITY_DN23775_c0_g1_i1.p1 TRINITY_DN23775_c0_g1~~TRINITY_DN23775_c0_g1_i1.p1  ORF type:complete len:292 (-),score=25.41 TRINITY_DN23775_c0_g1_i1:525-1400(-)